MVNLTDILPPSIAQDNKFYAIAKALENSLLYLRDNVDKVLLLPNLDTLPDEALNHLAFQWHVDEFDVNLDPDIKRSMIKDSLAWHKIKGTPAALKKILDIFFVNSYIQEWFQYDGEPYYFKIFAEFMRDIGDGDISFWRMFLDAKNVRSWLEALTLNLPDKEFPHYVGIVEGVGGVDADNFNLHLPNEQAQHSFIGIGTATYGVDNLNLNLPNEQAQHSFIGIGTATFGVDNLNLNCGGNKSSKIFSGFGEMFFGNIFIGADVDISINKKYSHSTDILFEVSNIGISRAVDILRR